MEIAKYCSVCGNGVVSQAVICPKCGSQIATFVAKSRDGDKSKVVAVILALTLGAWTWLYTYKLDRRKVWAIGLMAIPPIVWGTYWVVRYAISGTGSLDLWSLAFNLGVAFIWLALLNLWPIIDTILKPSSFFSNFDALEYSPIDREQSKVFRRGFLRLGKAVILGPLNWLLSYRADSWKFWLYLSLNLFLWSITFAFCNIWAEFRQLLMSTGLIDNFGLISIAGITFPAVTVVFYIWALIDVFLPSKKVSQHSEDNPENRSTRPVRLDTKASGKKPTRPVNFFSATLAVVSGLVLSFVLFNGTVMLGKPVDIVSYYRNPDLELMLGSEFPSVYYDEKGNRFENQEAYKTELREEVFRVVAVTASGTQFYETTFTSEGFSFDLEDYRIDDGFYSHWHDGGAPKNFKLEIYRVNLTGESSPTAIKIKFVKVPYPKPGYYGIFKEVKGN